jgi:CheY-like chemotaxis protein
MLDREPTHVLIVDEKERRDLYREMLEFEGGFRVSEAYMWDDALTQLRGSPDRLVVLVDNAQERGGGEQMLRGLHDEPQLAQRHAFILLTAGSRIVWQQRDVLAALSVAIVQKPFDVDDLLAAIRRAARRLAEE